MDFWRNLTSQWPCRLGDWLKANIAAPLSTLPRQITLRRVVFAAAFLVAAIGFAQLLPLDAALFMAGDMAFYFEIASVVLLIVARGHVRHVAQMAKVALRQGVRRAVISVRRGARQRRGPRKPLSSRAESDDGEGWPAGLAAQTF